MRAGRVGWGSVTTTVMTTLGVPPGLSNFIAHIFFINVLEGKGVRWILAGGVVAQTFSEFLN